jgi:mannose-6-phosphate isomerase-like protein (cupin superfamily)
MSYDDPRGEVSAVFRPDAEVEGLVRPKTATRFTAPGSVTDGRYGLFRWDMQPRAGGPQPHFHRTFSEAFYVLSGAVDLYDGNDWVVARGGDFLHVPEGGIHAFSNRTREPASMLILFAPGIAREEYFRGLAEIADSGRELSPEEMTAFLAQHDQYMVE